MKRPEIVDSVMQILEDGAGLTDFNLGVLVKYLEELEHDSRRSDRESETVQAVRALLSSTVLQRPMREYRFFRTPHDQWKEIQETMNTMAHSGWRLINMTYVEGARTRYWYMTWELIHELPQMR